MNNARKHAFTLIELLIVVAIIAILAAIAVPNFMEAQVRAKVSRVHSDLRTLNLACEIYIIDNNKYPPKTSMMQDGWWQTQLTTPIAYISSICSDPFCRDKTLANMHYQFGNCWKMRSILLVSVGPDGIDEFDEAAWMCSKAFLYPEMYDPSNGTTSRGDVWRISKQGGPIPKK